MPTFTYKQFHKLYPEDFALSVERKYPIMDISHAKGALARVKVFGTKKEEKIVTQEVYKRFPSLVPKFDTFNS